MKKENAYFQQGINICRENLSEARNQFEIERKRDYNSKAFGQPVRAKMDSIFYYHGIDRSGAFGGAIDGNYCYQWMPNTKSIFGELMDFYWRPIQG